MKQIILVLGLLVLFGCRKTDPPDPPMNRVELVNELVSSPAFIDFTISYIGTLAAIGRYHQDALGIGREEFIRLMRGADNMSGVAESIYTKFGVDFNQVIDRQNALDNLFVQITRTEPKLIGLSDEALPGVMAAAMSAGLVSKNPAWQAAKARIAGVTPQEGGGFAWQKETRMLDDEDVLTADEVWNCLKDAVGLNLAAQLSMRGLAAGGITLISKAVTRALAKFAGPIGTAIMAAEFGYCMYGAAND